MAEFQTDTDVDLPPEEVWDLVVDDEERAGWFGGETELDPVEGGDALFTEFDGTRRRGLVEEVVPDRRLAWTWWPEDSPDQASRVVIELAPLGPGTRVTVTETAATGSFGRPPAVRDAISGLELQAMLRSAAPVPVAGGR